MTVEHHPDTRSSRASGAPRCTAIRIIGARGSTEPQEGSRLLKPIGDAIARAFAGRASYSELQYPATIRRFTPPADIDLGESPSVGVRNLVRHLNSTARRSPETCFVLLGYSQGAQVVGDALIPANQRICGADAGALSERASAHTVAIALFGDPRFTRGEPSNTGTFDRDREGLYPRQEGALHPYADRLRNFCAQNDVTCQGPRGTMQGHTSYFSNAMPAEAADFIIRRIDRLGCLG